MSMSMNAEHFSAYKTFSTFSSLYGTSHSKGQCRATLLQEQPCIQGSMHAAISLWEGQLCVGRCEQGEGWWGVAGTWPHFCPAPFVKPGFLERAGREKSLHFQRIRIVILFSPYVGCARGLFYFNSHKGKQDLGLLRPPPSPLKNIGSKTFLFMH